MSGSRQGSEVFREAERQKRNGEFELAWSGFEQAAQLFASAGDAFQAQQARLQAVQCSQSALANSSTRATPSQPRTTPPPTRTTPLPPLPPPPTTPTPPPTTTTTHIPIETTLRSVANNVATGNHQALQQRARSFLSRARPVSEFFDVSRVSLPTGASLRERVGTNLRYFSVNYAVVGFCILAYVIFQSPVLLIGTILIFGLYVYSVMHPVALQHSRSQCVGFFANRSNSERMIAVVVIGMLVIYFLTSSIGSLVWAGICSLLIILFHASLLSPNQHALTDEDDPHDPENAITNADTNRTNEATLTHNNSAMVVVLPKAPAVAVANEMQERTICNVCLVHKCNAVCIPCGHSGCRTCLDEICRSGASKCPICRSQIRAVNPLFI